MSNFLRHCLYLSSSTFGVHSDLPWLDCDSFSEIYCGSISSPHRFENKTGAEASPEVFWEDLKEFDRTNPGWRIQRVVVWRYLATIAPTHHLQSTSWQQTHHHTEASAQAATAVVSAVTMIQISRSMSWWRTMKLSWPGQKRRGLRNPKAFNSWPGLSSTHLQPLALYVYTD